MALSKGRDWRCLAELAKVYDKTGHPAEAIQSARQALDLAMQQNNDQAAKNLQIALNRYERDASGAESELAWAGLDYSVMRHVNYLPLHSLEQLTTHRWNQTIFEADENNLSPIERRKGVPARLL